MQAGAVRLAQRGNDLARLLDDAGEQLAHGALRVVLGRDDGGTVLGEALHVPHDAALRRVPGR